MKPENRLGLGVGAFIVIMIALLAINSCLSSCTIHPVVVKPRNIAYSGGVQNAGILGYDKTGLIVNQDWIDKYDRLLEAFGQKLPADERVKPGDRSGITQLLNSSTSQPRYHIEFQVNDRFADLKYFERNSSSP